MKKTALLLAVIIAFGVMFTGCGSKSPDYNYDLSEYISVPDYKNIVIEVPQSNFDSEIQSDINELKIETDITDRGAALGDTISIKYSGRFDGEEEAFSGGTGTKSNFILGEGNFISGFEDAIAGHTVEDGEFDITVTFPEEYPSKPDYAGKAAIFTIEITALKSVTYPELTDELVKTNFGFDTIDDYKDALLKSYVNYNNIWSYLTSNSTVIKYPEKEMRYYKDYYYNSYENYYSGIDFNTILSAYLGVTAEQFDSYADSYAQQMVQVEMIMHKIARTEDITLSKEEYQQGLADYAEYYSYTDTKLFEKDYGKDSLKTALMMDEVTDFLIQTTTAVLVDGSAAETD